MIGSELVEAVLKVLLAGALGIITFFLRGTAQELHEVRRMAQQHEVMLGRHDERLKDLEQP